MDTIQNRCYSKEKKNTILSARFGLRVRTITILGRRMMKDLANKIPSQNMDIYWVRANWGRGWYG